MEGTTRTISEEMRMQVRQWIDEAAEKTALLSGATARVAWTGITPALINDSQVSAEVKTVAEELGEKVRVITDRPISLGGDNFAEFQRVVPGCYAYLGTANPKVRNSLNSLHNGNFDLDEDALLLGAGLYAEYALWWLKTGAALLKSK
ncbi:MAG: hypothetical protein MR922_11790 [Lachnospiraceae bacterium]|nr:hypothetical protein [Lachnospiraceae bacterium]